MTGKYDHFGVPASTKQENESYYEGIKTFATSPDDHPYRVEFLRFEDDSPVTGPLRDMPHVAYRIDDMNAALEGKETILEPFSPMPGLSVAFVKENGAVIEFMKFEGTATEFSHLQSNDPQ